MNDIECWLVRHAPSGQFMPAKIGTKIGRWSHWQPPQPGEIWCQVDPRIFFTYQSAVNALSAWLRGVWTKTSYQDGDFETGYYLVDDCPTPAEPDIPRVRSDMEIVPMLLKCL